MTTTTTTTRRVPLKVHHPFLTYLVNRLFGAIVVLLLISFGVFLLMYLAPGSVEQTLLPPGEASPEMLEAIRAKYHLNDPMLVQYGYWLLSAVQLDLGTSIRTGEPVIAAIAARMEITLWLAIMAFIILLVTAIPLGVVAALRKRSTVDRMVVGLSVFGVSTPAFATGLLLMFVFAVLLGWLPAIGPGRGFVDRLEHMILPSIALALSASALVLKLTRAAMIDALALDSITFAKARGLSPWKVTTSYALRNALIPIVTASGLVMGYMITGAVLVEVTFSLPGIGSMLVESVKFKDTPAVQGLALFIAVIIVVTNLITDIVYTIVDPRIRLGRAA